MTPPIPSTRALGLARAALGLLVWAESAAMWRPPHHVDHPDRLLLGLVLAASSSAPVTTWWLVSISPSALMMKPLP